MQQPILPGIPYMSPEDARLLTEAKKREALKAKKAARRLEKEQELSKNATILPSGLQKYSVILADPPWRYTATSGGLRDVENHYPTMSLKEIKALDVQSLCHKDSVLYLWATSGLLPAGIEVMKSWGFKYVSSAVWVKDKIGMGYWFRGQHEFLLVGKKGDIPPPMPEHRVSSIFHASRTEHSRKPESVMDFLDQAFPNHAKIELFSRNPREGWDAWGNEANL